MKRISELDALRGVALFGILLVNVFVFHAPLTYYGEFYGAFEGIQAKTLNAVVDFAGGKFLLIFAFLFGYGMALQQSNYRSTFSTYFVKRMLVLFVFGVLHILLFWFGDILASYALLGLLAMPVLRLSNKSVLVLAVLFVFFRSLYYFGVVGFDWPMVHMGRPAELQEFMAVFQQGTYVEVFQLRMKEFFAFIPENLVWYIPKTFGLFLVGVFAARKTLFARIREKNTTYLITAVLLMVLSITWVYVKPGLFRSVDLTATPVWRPVLIGVNVLFETAMGIGYILGFALLFQKVKWLCSVLAKAGRMALTNYLMQSLFCVLIFYGFGLGYYGKLRPTDLVLISIGVFAFNLIFSAFYLKIKRQGPLEYVWRKLIGTQKSPDKAQT